MWRLIRFLLTGDGHLHHRRERLSNLLAEIRNTLGLSEQIDTTTITAGSVGRFNDGKHGLI